PPIAAEVLVDAVAVVFAVGLVVLPSVAHGVFERKSVMAGNEIDARHWALHCVTRAGHACPDFAPRAAAAPPLAHPVAELVVPLRPTGGELPEKISFQIPWFGDQLYARKGPLDGGKKRRLRIEAVAGASQHGAEIEAESVDAEGSPGFQRVDHQS